MEYEKLAAMIKVREHALMLANFHRKRTREEENILREFVNEVDNYIVKVIVDDATKVKYGLKEISKKEPEKEVIAETPKVKKEEAPAKAAPRKIKTVSSKEEKVKSEE